MTLTIVVAGYVLGCFLTAYLMGRLESRDTADLAVFWPFLVVVWAIFAPLQFLAYLGRRHGERR